VRHRQDLSADQSKIFEEFQQADNSITRKKGGTGLGLAISKRIIDMHGKIGRFFAGTGATLCFTLPITVEQRARPS
jgi:signal transduction histidine kinase